MQSIEFIENHQSIESAVRDTLSAGIIIIDAENKIIVDVNDRASEMLGRDRDVLVGQTCAGELCRHEGTDCPINGMDIDCAEGMLRDLAGNRVPVLKTARNLDINGRRHIILIFIDQRGHESVSAGVRQSEELFKDLFENTSEMIQMVDSRGRIMNVNHAWCKHLGYSKEEVLDLDIWDIIHPEEHGHCMGIFEKIKSGGSFTGIETRFVRKDGQEIYVAGSINGRFDGSGNFMYSRGMFHDISDLKDKEERLQESMERFRKLSNLTFEGILLHRNGVALDLNDSFLEMFGYSRDEMIGKNVIEFLILSEYHDTIRNNVKKSIADPYEVMARRKDGVIFPVEIQAKDVMYENENIRVASVRDITDRKRMEMIISNIMKQLEAKNRELEDYTYTVSHDLKAPLVTIQGFSELLTAQYDDNLDDKAKHYLDRINQGSERLARLVSDLLELSRAGRMTGDFQDVDLNDIVRDTVTDLEARIKEKGIWTIYPDDMPTVRGDAVRLGQVFGNLVSNSVNYSDGAKDPVIEIGWTPKINHYEIWVRDNGMGIKEDDLNRIFNIFERASRGSEEGTGIGLSIVKKIIETHDGEVWAESSYGQGSRFVFTLPFPGVSD